MLPDFILRRRVFTMAIALCLTLAVSKLLEFWLSGNFGADFGMYYRVANEPLDNAYLPYNDLPFPYMPTMILWIQPLKLIGLWPAYLLWTAINVAALWFACRKYLPPWLAAFVFVTPPVVSGLCSGQVSAIITAAIIWAVGTDRRVLAGVAFGLIATIKPQFVALAPLLLLFLGDWRALGAAGATFVLAVTLSVAALGLDTWFVWHSALGSFHDMLVEENVISVAITPFGFADYRGLPIVPVFTASALLAVALVYICRRQPPLALTATIGTGSLLVAPYGLIQDLTVVAPFLVLMAWQGRFAAFLALASTWHPLPLLLTGFVLMRKSSGVDADATAGHGVQRRPAPANEADVGDVIVADNA